MPQASLGDVEAAGRAWSLSSPLKFLFYWKKRGIDSEKQDSATSMVL
jgi:hypothetical protein